MMHNARSRTFFSFFKVFLASVRFSGEDERGDEESEDTKSSHYFSASGVLRKDNQLTYKINIGENRRTSTPKMHFF